MTNTSPLCVVCFWQLAGDYRDPMKCLTGLLCRECWERRQLAMDHIEKSGMEKEGEKTAC